jgi:hypothetical protein
LVGFAAAWLASADTSSVVPALGFCVPLCCAGGVKAPGAGAGDCSFSSDGVVSVEDVCVGVLSVVVDVVVSVGVDSVVVDSVVVVSVVSVVSVVVVSVVVESAVQ